jgi:hypothetical protein
LAETKGREQGVSACARALFFFLKLTIGTIERDHTRQNKGRVFFFVGTKGYGVINLWRKKKRRHSQSVGQLSTCRPPAGPSKRVHTMKRDKQVNVLRKMRHTDGSRVGTPLFVLWSMYQARRGGKKRHRVRDWTNVIWWQQQQQKEVVPGREV